MEDETTDRRENESIWRELWITMGSKSTDCVFSCTSITDIVRYIVLTLRMWITYLCGFMLKERMARQLYVSR
jgi:hypothetical protein